MKKYCVVAISRQYCSGGQDIAKKLAEDLNVPYYDKEIITLASKESGLSEEAIRESKKRHTGSLLYSLYSMSKELPVADQVYLVQSKIIRELAEKGPCVLVGRCSDYVLRDNPNCLRVFIHAPLEHRVDMLRLYETDEREHVLESILQREDKSRANYYNYYTQQHWGDAKNFHITLDSSIGEDACVQILKQAVKAFVESEED